LHPIHPGLTDQHLYDETPRGQEIAIALDKAAQEQVPVLLVGDFNMSEESLDYQRITAVYRDAFREVGVGMGFTFPDHRLPQSRADGKLPPLPFPLIRLDYCFIGDGWTALEARVWQTSGGSDHRPLWVKLTR
jgi:endonuclease/exonuclease/phosphatase (EEP) superfamily protein YafD